MNSDTVHLFMKLARADRWDRTTLSRLVQPHELDRDARAALPGGHTLVVDESGTEPTGAYVTSAVFHQPEPDEEPDEDELCHAWTTPDWDLDPVGDSAAFLTAWRADRDTVSALIGAQPAVELIEQDGNHWHTALWPMGRNALALAQTEHFDSYSLFDMTALWVCRRDGSGPPVPDPAYAWLTEFPRLLGN